MAKADDPVSESVKMEHGEVEVHQQHDDHIQHVHLGSSNVKRQATIRQLHEATNHRKGSERAPKKEGGHGGSQPGKCSDIGVERRRNIYGTT